ncbi:hypothetical protein CAPTEDRAFT_210134 [Capitella teleta]|uniref:EGF-like domain-containing protein n=1 Tax=Capitella teleta TaxID=283909 RepID=R7TVX7_CAPTE|nr:hypothetical protein CAPTEDRAFT_210134 [Capitella teleta]|eukprot:ELT97742.1 hypothetical protein CAPTEDRAFT_210134 [Capitella teleta]
MSYCLVDEWYLKPSPLGIIVQTVLFGAVLIIIGRDEEDHFVLLITLMKGKPDASGMVDFEYDCKRSSMVCINNGTCAGQGGLCQCAPGFTSPDCSVNQSSLVGFCDPPCMNQGECYLDEEANSTFCLCPSMYTGDTCQELRVSSECYHDHIKAQLAPPVGPSGSFEGVIYVVGYEDDANCTFDTSDGNIFNLDLFFDRCGGAQNLTEPTGDETLFFTVVVRYDSLLTTDSDVEFDFTCRIAQSGGNVTWNLNPLTSNKDDRNLEKKKVTDELVPVELQLLNKDNNSLTGAQKLGDLITMLYTLNAGAVYDSFRLEELIVSNGLVGNKRRAVTFVYDGCVTEDAYKKKKIVQDFKSDPSEELSLTFKVFKLPFSHELIFENTMKLCKGTGDCNATDCSAVPFGGAGRRRRRSAELISTNGDGDYERLDTRVHVWFPGSPDADPQGEVSLRCRICLYTSFADRGLSAKHINDACYRSDCSSFRLPSGYHRDHKKEFAICNRAMIMIHHRYKEVIISEVALHLVGLVSYRYRVISI